MKTFLSLLDGDAPPSQQQALASKELPQRLAESKLRNWSPGMPISGQGERVLIGIATWSIYDLKLLDSVQDSTVRFPTDRVIDVFDVDQCKSSEDFDLYVPGIGMVYQTPIVGVWRQGVKVSSAWGASGRELLKEIGVI
ncbi:MAG TPA: hypothetical protein VKB46_01395 [Pyrinomonadaceae bacterium]|nr:hypothetical protein [Pyrinomonadaceae bacterium]